MEQVSLKELHFSSRAEALAFLKKLWNDEPAECPLCGTMLKLLHQKAKKTTATGNVLPVTKHSKQCICLTN